MTAAAGGSVGGTTMGVQAIPDEAVGDGADRAATATTGGGGATALDVRQSATMAATAGVASANEALGTSCDTTSARSATASASGAGPSRGIVSVNTPDTRHTNKLGLTL